MNGNIIAGYCDNCGKIDTNSNCTVYRNPMAFVRTGCAFSPVAKAKYIVTEKKGRIGQQKQSKNKR